LLFSAEALLAAIVNTGKGEQNFYWVQPRYAFPIASMADSRFPELIPSSTALLTPFPLRSETSFYLGDGVHQTATSYMIENGLTPNPASFTAYRYRNGEVFSTVIADAPIVPLPIWIGGALDSSTFYYHYKRVDSVGVIIKSSKIPHISQNGFCLGVELEQDDSGVYVKNQRFSKTSDGEIFLLPSSTEINNALGSVNTQFNAKMASIVKGKLYMATSSARAQIASGADKFDFQVFDLRTGQLTTKTVKIKPINVSDPSLVIESISYYQ
jgi:hypothetical protein